MTELDFDELDKAVNSLMTESSVEEEPKPDNVTEPAPTPSSTAVAVSSPATRRRGQFMDVMHPSSNMRQAPAPVTHQAADVTPPMVSEAVKPDDTPVADEALPMSSPEPMSEQATTEQEEVSSTWTEPSEETTEEATVPEEVVETPPEPPVDQLQTDDPLTSPFLPDAKVEKRPLGEPVPYAEPVLESKTSDMETPAEVHDIDTKEPEQPDTTEGDMGAAEPVPLPDELKEDVVAVEANEVMHEEAIEAPAENEVAPEVTQPISGSITQQYEEQPSTGEQTNGAIYDTDSYHQPLDGHPAKKKSSVLTWILWTIVLLIVGATAGAAWFYFTTQ